MPPDDSVKLAAVARVLRQALALAEGGSPKPPVTENSTVEFLLHILEAETEKLEAVKQEVARKDAELTLKLTFAKNKERELAEKEAEVSRFEAQLRVREGQVERREGALKGSL